MPQVLSINIHNIVETSQKKLVLSLVDLVDRNNGSTESGQFFTMFKKSAWLVKEDLELNDLFQFGWTEDRSMLNGIIMGELSIPNMIAFNLSSYEFYMSEDLPEQMTPQSVHLWLRRLSEGNVTARGGRDWPTRIRRILFDVSTNVYEMFYNQPILTTCLFGVPLAFFSIIIYSVCSTDFSVDREEIYPADEDDEELDDEDAEYELDYVAEDTGMTNEENKGGGGHQKAE